MDDERRIYYQITGAGAKALAAELKRYKDLVKLAQKRKFYLVNVLLAVIMLALFVIISGAFISEIYEYRS